MPATSSGRILKPRKIQRDAALHKNHRWESFTSKISQLSSLDPIRKVRRHDLDTESLSATTSYFRAGLEKWRELNMSEDFVTFSQEVLPLSSSLPQILHFEDKIMDVLVIYLAKREREALEPLLNLLTDFAHDLGVRFEKHYAKSMELVTSIAGTPGDVEVIEWSFTCLAFMFKYLSKLLVPDLRATYALMAPLLGKLRQPPHIARFAAEAMSFLVKKAAAPAHREKALPLIIQHIKDDLDSLQNTKEYELYYHGVMTLFAEAIKGNGLTIHTSGSAIFRALFAALKEQDLHGKDVLPWVNVIGGVLTSIVHHSTSDTFGDILNVVLAESDSAVAIFVETKAQIDLCRIVLSARAIGISAGVRMGSRIGDWPALLRAMSNILRAISKTRDTVHKSENDIDTWHSLIQSVSILLQYSPMDAVIPFISGFMDAITKEPLAKWFLTFCSYLGEAEPNRFRTIALPYFQKFVTAHWSDADNGDTLCVLLPKMVASGVLPSTSGIERFAIPQSWQDQIVSKFERLEVSPFPEQASPALHDRSPTTWHDRCLPKYNALLEVLNCTTVHPSTSARIAEILLRKLKLALRPSSSLAPEEANFIVGRGFSTYSRIIKGTGEVDGSLEPLLHAAAPRYARLPNFLEALLAYKKIMKSPPSSGAREPKPESSTSLDDDSDPDMLSISLTTNLSTGSHELRLLSLRLLDQIHTMDQASNSEALSTMIMIEQTPLEYKSARSISMHMRKLATLHAQQSLKHRLRLAIERFCFGMLTVKFAPVWEDARTALKEIAGTNVAGEEVAGISFNWLETPSQFTTGSASKLAPVHSSGLTDFECPNLMKLDQIAKASASEVSNSRDMMLQNFEIAQQLVSMQPTSARCQALFVLNAIPCVAEKRSRLLVPALLSWADHQIHSIEEADGSQVSLVSDWSNKDHKSLLDLFALFKNPKALYKSVEVHRALLQLVSNGNIEIQRSALKALFTWKRTGIRPYEENLLNLLDEARFKEESVLLLKGERVIQAEHRADIVPLLLRLLYGRIISRKGLASGRQGMEARRRTVLRSLPVEDIEGFLDIALGPLGSITMIDDGKADLSALEQEFLTVKQQVGFAKMMEAVLKEIGAKSHPFCGKVLNAVLYCLVLSSRRLRDDVDEIDDEGEHAGEASLLKVIRQTSLKCLTLLFENAAEFDWTPYMGVIMDEVVVPRLKKLPIDASQAVTGVLRLFYNWSTSPRTVLFLGSNDQILGKIMECLSALKTKEEVKLFALQIIRNVAGHARDVVEPNTASLIKSDLLLPKLDEFLNQIAGVLRAQRDVSKDLLEACVETINELATMIFTSAQARSLIEASIFLLDQPSRKVNPKIKNGLLRALEHFVPLYDVQDEPDLKDRIYNTITSLFGFFRDKPSRELLSRILTVYSQRDPMVSRVAELCQDFNSYTEGRLDEPDYDLRLKTFNIINEKREHFTAREWRPLLFNLLFYIKDDEEFGILSSNSSDGICRFIDAAGGTDAESEQAAFREMFSSILMPALVTGVREPSEVIRREFLKVMAHVVRAFPTWSEVIDMHVLLAGDDELEGSFFNNILSAGKGRQSNALSQLSNAARRGKISSRNISRFFIPIIEHFIFDRAEGSDAHNLAAEASTAVGVLASSLEWPHYRSMLRRFIGFVESRPDLAKQVIRLVGKVIDALALVSEETNPMDGEKAVKPSALAATMPPEQRIADDLTSNILPPLMAYVHHKDESTVSLRVPVAVIIVRLLKLLPQRQMDERLPAVLTDICQILRSRAQEARDMSRDTLAKICVLIGPSCFGFVLKELRGALKRGYQLHVLSYTMHSILVTSTPGYSPGDIDYCLPSIVDIIMDDIFGLTGQEKDAEEYVSKMKEVKSSKSHDSMELIARTATLSHLRELVRPIQLLLKERMTLRMVRRIDELLQRISTGLLKNPASNNRESMIFCYEIIHDVYNSDKVEEIIKPDHRITRFLIQKGAKKSGDRGSTTVYTYKLVRFALDALRALLKKHDNLRTTNTLMGFIPMLGDSVSRAEEEIRVGAFRLLATITKVPLTSEGASLYRVATAEATKSISASSSTTSEISQAALKLLSVILRDRQDIAIKDAALDQLLTRLKDDLTEPERRHVTFNFLRAVLDSKFETATVYDIFDYVGTIMVTNDDKETRDLARGAYFQFLREYPQKKTRWTKQLGFIVANLKYEREGGRLSILEVIHLLLSKSSDDFVQEVSATCFVPLIFVLANDESEKCRMAAGEVIKEVFTKADRNRMTTFLTLLRSWTKQLENPSVSRLALQTYGFYFEAQEHAEDADVSMLQQCISGIVKTPDRHDSDWEVIYAALQLAAILCQKFPESMFDPDTTPFWSAVGSSLSFPHSWVKLSGSRLISVYFADFARTNAEAGLEGLPLKGSRGLKLSGEAISDLIYRILGMFKTPNLGNLLATEIVKNLGFLGRCAAANKLKPKSTQQAGDPEDSEDPTDSDEPAGKSALQYLFSRLSFFLRRETFPPRAENLIPRTASLQLLQVICKSLPTAAILPSLQIILLPLHNLTDPSVTTPYSTDPEFRAGYERLKSASEELMETLKRKCGTQDYTKDLLKVRETVKERRMQRNSKRKIEAVAMPEKWGAAKKKKVERKHQRRKEKAGEHRSRRHEL